MTTESKTLMEAIMELWRESIKPGITKALELTPEDKMNWKPEESFLTFGEVFLHIARTSGWWFGEFMHGRKRKPVDEKFGYTKKELAEQLEEHWARMEQFFAEPIEAFEKVYQIEHDGKIHKFSGCWVFIHLLEHDIHHRSQINQYLRILGITPPQV
jgi:uncharacterized damage-inducible protein DinB